MKRKEYDCEEASVNFINTIFPLLIGIPLGACTVYSIISIFENPDSMFGLIALAIFLSLLTLLAYSFALKQIINNIKVRKFGRVINATVCGYEEDNISINDVPAKVVKLDIHGDDNDDLTKYQLYKVEKKYAINDQIELLQHKDYYLIRDKKENTKELIIIICSLLAVVIANIFIIYFLANDIYYYSNGITITSAREIEKYKANHPEYRTKLKKLNYDIPENFQLKEFQIDYNYRFVDKDDNHICVINIYGSNNNTAQENVCVGDYEATTINDTKWCRKNEVIAGKNVTDYTIDINKQSYRVSFVTEQEEDEYCAVAFEKVAKTLKIENTK